LNIIQESSVTTERYSKLISKDDQFMNDKWNAGTRFLPSCI